MEPIISNLNVSHNNATFTLSDVNVSIANGLRRTIMSEIPVIVCKTYPDNENNAIITKNTSRMNNEIIKQRLSCIPIMIDDMNFPIETYILEVSETNSSDNVMVVTSEHFKIKNVQNGQYLSREKTKTIFPPNSITKQYIDFVRLRPKISDEIPGESIALSCKFSISSAKEDGMFNVTSTCVYGNTPDNDKIDAAWEKEEGELKSKQVEGEELALERDNFMLLQGQRICIPNSFDYTLDSIGMYDSVALIEKACDIIAQKCETLITSIQENSELIQRANSTMSNCFDVTLKNEDYTLGKIVEYFLYTMFFENDAKLSFCGFKKFHPHDDDSIIRIGYKKEEHNETIQDDLVQACKAAIIILNKIKAQFD
uniref:DNA-directed RNA polymerase RpoA/D/Rpb3-type domain-containing protein n=1 Tax=viral metagenome TaxID=1070528 RepID=A0A6C0EIK5_9ZZZZ